MDISETFKTSVGGNHGALKLLESRTAKQDIKWIDDENQLPSSVKSYKAYVENHFSTESYIIRCIRFENTGENLGKELVKYLTSNGIEISTSPEYAPEINGLIDLLVKKIGL